MTPFELEILLHYYSRADDHPVMFQNPPIWPETRDRFMDNALLAKSPVGYMSPAYVLTNRGHAFIRDVLKTPLPVQVWASPATAEKIKAEQ